MISRQAISTEKTKTSLLLSRPVQPPGVVLLGPQGLRSVCFAQGPCPLAAVELHKQSVDLELLGFWHRIPWLLCHVGLYNPIDSKAEIQVNLMPIKVKSQCASVEASDSPRGFQRQFLGTLPLPDLVQLQRHDSLLRAVSDTPKV